jgi:hypothetical protein
MGPFIAVQKAANSPCGVQCTSSTIQIFNSVQAPLNTAAPFQALAPAAALPFAGSDCMQAVSPFLFILRAPETPNPKLQPAKISNLPSQPTFRSFLNPSLNLIPHSSNVQLQASNRNIRLQPQTLKPNPSNLKPETFNLNPSTVNRNPAKQCKSQTERQMKAQVETQLGDGGDDLQHDVCGVADEDEMGLNLLTFQPHDHNVSGDTPARDVLFQMQRAGCSSRTPFGIDASAQVTDSPTIEKSCTEIEPQCGECVSGEDKLARDEGDKHATTLRLEQRSGSSQQEQGASESEIHRQIIAQSGFDEGCAAAGLQEGRAPAFASEISAAAEAEAAAFASAAALAAAAAPSKEEFAAALLISPHYVSNLWSEGMPRYSIPEAKLWRNARRPQKGNMRGEGEDKSAQSTIFDTSMPSRSRSPDRRICAQSSIVNPAFANVIALKNGAHLRICNTKTKSEIKVFNMPESHFTSYLIPPTSNFKPQTATFTSNLKP